MPKVVIGLAIFAVSFLLHPPVFANSHIVINEFASDVDTGQKEWVEFYNSNSTDQLLAGWFLEERTGSDLSGISSYSLDSITVPALGFAIYEFSGSKLNNGGDILTLKNGSTKVDEVAYGSASNSQVDAPGKSQAAGRKTDGSGNWVIFDSFTRGTSNNSGQAAVEPSPSSSSSPQTTQSSSSPKSPSPSPKKSPSPSPSSQTTKNSGSVLAESKTEIESSQEPNLTVSSLPSPFPSTTPQSASVFKTKVATVLIGSGTILTGLSIGLFLWYKKRLANKDEDIEN